MKITLIYLSIFAFLVSKIYSTEQESMEELLKIEAEFNTETYYFKNGHLNFLAEAAAPSDVTPPTPSGSGTGPNWLNSFDKLTDGLLKSTNVYMKAVEAFKTKRTSELVKILDGKGFEHFAATGQVKVSKGIKEQYLDKYIANLSKIVKVPTTHQDAIDGILSEIQFAEKNFWNNYKTAFDIELAPDTMVIKKTFMLLGGIWSDDKEVYEKRDRNLTTEDIDAVMNFFTILAFKGMGDTFGIKFDFPKF